MFSPPYDLELIGKIERMNRTLQDKITYAMKISAIKSKKLWFFVLSDAIDKLNIIPKYHFDWNSPYNI